MFAATRVMTAGKAGLESLPHFVDEFLAQGITQLAPWAADHNFEQIDKLNQATLERRAGPWKVIHDIGDSLGASDLGTHMQLDMAASQRLVRRINPHAAEAQLADSPAQLAAWCRQLIIDTCRDTLDLWERFKLDNGIPSGQQKLAVVIPFCPEGPTSGTVGIYLGAALRKHFADEGKGNELVVWGIELCPPILDRDENKSLNAAGKQNAFRGYLAREDLLRGVPLSKDDPDDQQLHQPFDINIVFDGGANKLVDERIDREDIWKALDRAAAQTTACLLNGAAGGDVDESTNWLKQGKRWNAYLAHVISELSYNSACRYLRYRVSLPWHRSRETWDERSVDTRKDILLRYIEEDIRPMLADEEDPMVRERIEYLVGLAKEIRKMSPMSRFFNKKGIQEKIANVVAEDERYYVQDLSHPSVLPQVTPKTAPFCVNIALPANLRQEATEKWRDNGSPEPISDVLGMAGALDVRKKIESLIQEVLQRGDYQVSDSSQADFDQIIAISIEDRSRAVNNEQFRPSREFLRDFISVEQRDKSGTFNVLQAYDLSEHLRSSDPKRYGKWSMPNTLSWHLSPLSGLDEDEIPVEYSFLVLARCRPEDGFRDIRTFNDLKNNYDEITSNPNDWREFARYHSIKPPAAMEEGCAAHPDLEETAPGEDSSPPAEQRPEEPTNGYREILASTTENS